MIARIFLILLPLLTGCAGPNNTLDLVQCRDIGWTDDCKGPAGSLWFTQKTWDRIGTVKTAALKKVSP